MTREDNSRKFEITCCLSLKKSTPFASFFFKKCVQNPMTGFRKLTRISQ